MTGWRIGWMVAPEPLVRPIDRLQGNLAISVPTLSQIAAVAAFDGRAEMDEVKHGYEENRQILVEGCRGPGSIILSGRRRVLSLRRRLSLHYRQLRFRQRMLDEAHVATTPGIDFDPRAARFVRFCYAGSAAEMREAVERMGRGWSRLRSCVSARVATSTGCSGYACVRIGENCRMKSA